VGAQDQPIHKSGNQTLSDLRRQVTRGQVSELLHNGHWDPQEDELAQKFRKIHSILRQQCFVNLAGNFLREKLSSRPRKDGEHQRE
jgi:hypothetical protein